MQVSSDGGISGWWTPDGKQVVYASDDSRSLWRADVQPGPPLRVGAPVTIATLPPNVEFIAPMPDRRTFLAFVPERSGEGSITIVQNWLSALASRQ